MERYQSTGKLEITLVCTAHSTVCPTPPHASFWSSSAQPKEPDTGVVIDSTLWTRNRFPVINNFEAERDTFCGNQSLPKPPGQESPPPKKKKNILPVLKPVSHMPCGTLSKSQQQQQNHRLAAPASTLGDALGQHGKLTGLNPSYPVLPLHVQL